MFRYPCVEDVAKAPQLLPRNVGFSFLEIVAESCRGFTKHLQVSDCGVLDHLRLLESCSCTFRILADARDTSANMIKQDRVLIVSRTHSGTASRRTRSRIAGRRKPSVTTSTGLFKSSSTSTSMPPKASPLASGVASTRRSTSLSSCASPRAIDPNTRTLHSPWRSAMASRALRFWVIKAGNSRGLACLVIFASPDNASFQRGLSLGYTSRPTRRKCSMTPHSNDIPPAVARVRDPQVRRIRGATTSRSVLWRKGFRLPGSPISVPGRSLRESKRRLRGTQAGTVDRLARRTLGLSDRGIGWVTQRYSKHQYYDLYTSI